MKQKGLSAIAGIVIGLVIAGIVVGGVLLVNTQQKSQSEPTFEKKITNWSLYQIVANQEVINDLGCEDATLAKEYNTYASRVRNEQAAKSFRIYKSLSGIFSIDLITTPNYYKWGSYKLDLIRQNCFFEPYVNSPGYPYPDRLVFVLPQCVVGDAPSDPKLAAQQETESSQCLLLENEIRKTFEISIKTLETTY